MLTMKAGVALSILFSAIGATAGITHYVTKAEATVSLACPDARGSEALEEMARLAREAEERRVREAEAMSRFTGRPPLQTTGNPRY